MVTGVKISEFTTTTDIVDGYIPLIRGGVNYKVLSNLIATIVSGIGRETTVFSASDLYDVDTFDVGYIYSIDDTEANAVLAGAPSSGLSGGSSVFWTIFTFGTDALRTQLAFSPQSDIEKFYIRYGEIGTDAVWSDWYLLPIKSNDIPRLKLADDGASSATITLTLGNYVTLTFTPGVFSSLNNHFTDNGDGSITYTGEACAMNFHASISGRSASGTNTITFGMIRNNLEIDDGHGGNVPVGYTFPQLKDTIYIQKNDVLKIWILNSNTNVNILYAGSILTGDWQGWAALDDFMSAELFVNPDMEDTSGFINLTNCTIGASGGEVTVTGSGGGTPATFEASVSGLTIGERYRVEIGARRGASGTGQTITGSTFGTIASTAILTTSEEFFVFDLLATATSGVINFTVDTASPGGESLILSKLSVREYL